jgi:hypothetical protein
MRWVFSTPLPGVDKSMVIVIIYHLYTELWSWLYYSWIHNYICNQCWEFESRSGKASWYRWNIVESGVKQHNPILWCFTKWHLTTQTEVVRYESQSQKTMFNNTLFRTELFIQLVFGKSRCESKSNPNPYKVKVMVYILPIILFKPVDTKKDDWDQGSHSFYFVCHRKAVMPLTWAMSFIKISQI